MQPDSATNSPAAPIEPQLMPETPSPVSSKPKSNILAIILSVVLSAIIFGVGGYYLGQNSWQKMSAIDDQILTSPEPNSIVSPTTTTNTPTSDAMSDMSDWKNYMDSTYEYTIKYPASSYKRIICPGSEAGKFMLIPATSTGDDPIQAPTCARDSFYPLELFPNVETFLEVENTPDYQISSDDITLDEVSAKKYTFNQINPSQGPLWYVLVQFQKVNTKYQIIYQGKCGYNPDADKTACENEFNEIISTFKFTS